MQQTQVPLLGFAAASGTGKTTLLEQIIPLIKAQGLRVGLIKKSHHNVQVDQPGKDSFRFRVAGGSPVMLCTSHRRVLITEFSKSAEPHLFEELQFFDQSQVDLILVEGFKSECFPKIELHRAAVQEPLLYLNDPNIIAVATDSFLELPTDLVQLDINQPKEVTNFIIKQFMGDL